MPGRDKIQAVNQSNARKIVNMNAISNRKPKAKVKGKVVAEVTMKIDFSAIHKENVILEENLEDHLVHIQRNERKAMEEKGEQLDEVRREIDVITKLQEAVNARNPGDSTDILSRTGRIGQQWAAGENRVNRAQMKIDAEREKFSSKSLFNSRRFHNSSGLEFMPTRKYVKHDHSDRDNDQIQGDVSRNDQINDRTQKPKQNKGYLKETFSSLAGFRPVTATLTQDGFRPMTAVVSYRREQKEDDILPPRPKSAVLRSRSRRQLELLCRVVPKEDELEVTHNFQIDWKVIHEKRRRRRLQEIKSQHEEMQDKINSFLKNIDLFNRRPATAKYSNSFSYQDQFSISNRRDSKELSLESKILSVPLGENED